MTFDTIIAGGQLLVPGALTAHGLVVLPSGIVTHGGDPLWWNLEQMHPGGFDIHPELRPFGIDGFWNRPPIYAVAPLALAPNIGSGVATDPRTYMSALPLSLSPQLPSPGVPSY